MADHHEPGGLDVDAVAAYLTGLGVAVRGPLAARRITGGRSNLTYAISDSDTTWVVRRPPMAGLTSSAHDMAREFRVTSALSQTDVPVPEPIGLCEDVSVIGAPFTVVQFVEGSSIRDQDDLNALDDEKVAQCVQNVVAELAGLHAVDHVGIGLGTFGRPGGYAARQLRRWSGQWTQVADHADQRAQPLAAALSRCVPDQPCTSIVHGDYRIDNTLLGLDTMSVNAIVDWELSTIGDPVADVAMMCAYRHQALDLILDARAAWTSPRLASVEDLASSYEALGSIRLENWEFHLALAYFKLAVIAQGIAHREQAAAAGRERISSAADAVPELLAAGAGLLHER